MPPRKRAAEEALAGPRRSSRRTSTKSQYFEADYDDSDEPGKDSDTAEPQPKRKRGRPPKKKPALAKEDSEESYNEKEEQEEPEDEDEDSDDSDAPPKVTIIPLPKLISPGGVPYEDAKVHPNSMEFLKLLKAHNERPWLKCEQRWPWPLLYLKLTII